MHRIVQILNNNLFRFRLFLAFSFAYGHGMCPKRIRVAAVDISNPSITCRPEASQTRNQGDRQELHRRASPHGEGAALT